MEAIRRSTPIEDMIRNYPASVRFMVEKGLPCYVCGEPVWGTFEEVARQSGKSERDIDLLVDELKAHLQAKG